MRGCRAFWWCCQSLGTPSALLSAALEGSLQERGRPSQALPPGGWAPRTLKATRSHITRGSRVLRAGGESHLQSLCPPPASVPHV